MGDIIKTELEKIEDCNLVPSVVHEEASEKEEEKPIFFVMVNEE